MAILELVIPKSCRCFAPVRVVQPNGIGIIKRLENSLIKSAVMVVAERDIFSDDPVARYYKEVVKLVRIIAARIAVIPEPLRGRRLNSVGFESSSLSTVQLNVGPFRTTSPLSVLTVAAVFVQMAIRRVNKPGQTPD
jgi:hypothetical protein